METIAANITLTFSVVAIAALFSGELFPLGDVPKQLSVALVWFVAGSLVAMTWQN